MKKYILLFFATVVLTTACNNDFMERYQLDEVSMSTYWSTEADLVSWINTWYEMTASSAKYKIQTGGYIYSNILLGNGINRGFDASVYQQRFRDFWSDNYASTNSRAKTYMQIKTGTNSIPTSSWDIQGIAGWWWFLLRPINIFLENYDKADLPEEIRQWYGGQGYMWRAWFYYDKVKLYGDVPLVTKELDVTDTLILYGPRTPREDVMAQVLEDINIACDYMPETYNNGVPGFMNKWAAYALKSRICLFEGTWRKYHGGNDADMWLKEAADAARYLIDNGGFSLYSTGNPTEDYRHNYYQTDLKGNPEIIYWKKYVDGVNPTAAVTYWTLAQGGATRSAVEDYLCTDGLPINLSNLYMGDDSIEATFINRDPRMRQTILHPDDAGPDKPLHYLGGDTKPFPILLGQSGGRTNTGYMVMKHYNDYGWVNWNHDETSAIIFGYNEVLLNYAEAKAELGEADQGVLDISINKLRDRVNMPHLQIGSIPNDTRHDDMGVSDLLVEIRRERRVELFGDGFRYDDLRRWKMFVKENSKLSARQGILWDDVAQARYTGAVVKTSDDPVSGKTYIDVFEGTGFLPLGLNENKHYLWPIPTYVITDNPNLGQTPGWEND